MWVAQVWSEAKAGVNQAIAQNSGGSHRQSVIDEARACWLMNDTEIHSIIIRILTRSPTGRYRCIHFSQDLFIVACKVGSCSGYYAPTVLFETNSLRVSPSMNSFYTSGPGIVVFIQFYEHPEYYLYVVYVQSLAQVKCHNQFISPFIDTLPPVSWW